MSTETSTETHTTNKVTIILQGSVLATFCILNRYDNPLMRIYLNKSSDRVPPCYTVMCTTFERDANNEEYRVDYDAWNQAGRKTLKPLEKTTKITGTDINFRTDKAATLYIYELLKKHIMTDDYSDEHNLEMRIMINGNVIYNSVVTMYSSDLDSIKESIENLSVISEGIDSAEL